MSSSASGRWRPALLLAPAVAVVVVLFVGGLAIGVAQSFGYLPFIDGWRWSADAYRSMGSDPAVRASLALTLRVAVVSTAAATVLGVSAALLVHRTGRGRRALTTLLASSLAVPHLVGAVAMLLLLSQTGVLSRLGHATGLTATPADFPALTADRFGWGIIAEYVWKETAFIGVVTLAALTRRVDDLDGVARTLGARGWQRLRHVTLPVIAPSVGAAAVVVLAFTVGSYEVPVLLGRPFPATLPVVALQHHQHAELGLRADAMAISVVTAAFVGAVALAYLTAVDRRRPRAAR